MTTAQRIARNTSVVVASQLLSYVLAFFYMLYMARDLGLEGFGVISFAVSFVALFAILADMGISFIMVRDIARDRSLASTYVSSVIPIKVLLTALTFGLIALTISLMDYPWQTIEVVYLVTVSTVCVAFSQIAYAVFQAYERLEYQSAAQALNSVLMLVGVLVCIRQGVGVLGFAAVYASASFIVLVCNLVVLELKFARPSMGWVHSETGVDVTFWIRRAREVLPFFLAGVFSVIAFRVDMTMLSVMKGDEAVGLYSAAYRLLEVLLFIPTAYLVSVYPVLSRFHASSKTLAALLSRKSFQYLLILALPIAAGTTIIAHRAMVMIFGAEYADSTSALQLLIWTIPPLFLSTLAGTILNSADKQVLNMKIMLFAVLANVAANLVLIPRYSYAGAAIATVGTGFIAGIVYMYYVEKLVPGIAVHRLAARPAIASGIMAIVALFLADLNLFFLVPLAAVVYFAVLFLMGTFSREDYALARQVVNSRQRQ